MPCVGGSTFCVVSQNRVWPERKDGRQSICLCTLCSMPYALCSVPYPLCSVLYALSPMLCVLCSMPYDPPLRLIRRQAASPVGCAASIISCIDKPRVERNVDGRVWSLTLEMRPECAMDIQIGKATTKRAADRGLGNVFLGSGVGFFCGFANEWSHNETRA